jgi:hypothetical protein
MSPSAKLLPLTRQRGLMLSPRHAATSHCDCAAHRVRSSEAGARASFWGALLPVLACAFCPACITAWAPLLATAGIGVALNESQHSLLLIVAIALSLGVASWRARRARAWAPVLLTGLGGAAMLGGHAWNDNAPLESLGVLCLLSAAALGALPRSVRRAPSPEGAHS